MCTCQANNNSFLLFYYCHTHSYIGSGRLYDFWNNRTVLSNETEILSQTFQSPIMVQKWQECCHGALACCVNYLAVKDGPVKEPSIGPSCPRTWDGWTCWPNEVSPGSTVQQACAKHIYWRMTAPPCRGLCVSYISFITRANICVRSKILLLGDSQFPFDYNR